MAEDTKTYVFGGDQVPAWLAYGNNNNGWFGGNGLAGGALGFLLGLVFGNGGFGNWGGFNGGNGRPVRRPSRRGRSRENLQDLQRERLS